MRGSLGNVIHVQSDGGQVRAMIASEVLDRSHADSSDPHTVSRMVKSYSELLFFDVTRVPRNLSATGQFCTRSSLLEDFVLL